jgi:hypothetical protein
MIPRNFTPLAIVSVVLLMFLPERILAEIRITPRLELNHQFIDIETVTTNESGTLTRISPGINAKRKAEKCLFQWILPRCIIVLGGYLRTTIQNPN